MNTSMGNRSVEAYGMKYKKFGGILISVKQMVKMMGKDFIVTVDSIKFNVKIPKSFFKLPDDIRALLEKKVGDQ